MAKWLLCCLWYLVSKFIPHLHTYSDLFCVGEFGTSWKKGLAHSMSKFIASIASFIQGCVSETWPLIHLWYRINILVLYRKGLEDVKGWTRKIDIFKKEYLVVPINEKYKYSDYSLLQLLIIVLYSKHWFLAIIHWPGNTILSSPSETTKDILPK